MSNEKKNTAKDPAEDTRYHDTLLLLRKYRHILWSLESEKRFLEFQFASESGQSIDEFLHKAQTIGMDLDIPDLEDRTRSIARSAQTIKLIDMAVSMVRTKVPNGEMMYQILMLTYILPEKLKSIEINEKLENMGFLMCDRSFRHFRKEGVKCVSTILWGYASRDSMGVLDQFDRMVPGGEKL